MVCIVLLGAVLSEARALASDEWPGHGGIFWTGYTLAFVAALAALIVRRQRKNGEPPYGVVRASALAVSVFVAPMLVFGGLAVLLTALHVWS